jgi:hypothetical protein
MAEYSSHRRHPRLHSHPGPECFIFPIRHKLAQHASFTLKSIVFSKYTSERVKRAG